MHGKKKYNLPDGYSLLQATLRSKAFLDQPIEFISRSMDKYSGTYSSSISPGTHVILTQDPGFISYVLKDNHKNYQKSALSGRAANFFGHGLLYSNGANWLRQRRLIQPGFHKEKIQGLYHVMIHSIDEFIATFPVGEGVDIYPLVHELSFNILIKSLFHVELPAGSMEAIKQIFSDLQDFLLKDINQPWRKIFYPITGTKTRNFKKAQLLRAIILEIIRERKASNSSQADLLDMLLNSKYEDTGEYMIEEQVTDEVLIFFLAGHETTANTLSWLLYLIASNQEVRQRLITSFDRDSVYGSLNNEYLRATISEGMRLYPAAWMTDRVAIEEDRFGQFSYPKNTIIIPFFFGLHRDKKYWNDAAAFMPERFMEGSKAVKANTYFPFGAGPRMCIGNNFALAEMSFFLFSFLQKFQVDKTDQLPLMKPLVTLRPDKIILSISKKKV